MSGSPEAAFQLAELAPSDLAGLCLGVIGAVLVLGGAYFASVLINKDPREISGGQKLTAVALLLSGLLLSIAGLSGALWEELAELEPPARFGETPKLVSPSQSFNNLLANARVDRLIRLIVWKPNEPQSRLDQLKSLGKDGQAYTLVADYDEMRGRTAAEAARLFGASVEDGDRVSAIIFRREPRRITPVSAIGLLQTVAEVDAKLDAGKKLGIEERLSTIALTALQLGQDRPALDVWAWSTYGANYPDYCKLAQEFRCDPNYAAHAELGQIDANWHPLGFSERVPAVKEPCGKDADEKFCPITDPKSIWPSLAPYYGARIFYIKNEPLTAIDGRALVDFDLPDIQRIPSLDLGEAAAAK
jgi:hypothetical protein